MIVVDRIEGKFAVIETEDGMKNIPVKDIIGKVTDGTVLKIVDGKYQIDVDATKKRTIEVQKETKGLWG